jgi:hypothetical protein
MVYSKWLLALAMTVIVGCKNSPDSPTKQEVIGIYMGKYASGIETIEIRADGSFSQQFRLGSNLVYASDGKWEIRDAIISFTPFVFPTEMLRTKMGAPAQKVDVAPGGWARNPIHIEFGPWPYHVAKVSGEGAQVPKSAFGEGVQAKNSD